MTAKKLTIPVRIVWNERSSREYEGKPTEFGLQDTNQKVHPGTKAPDGATHFECMVEVRRDPKIRRIVFAGPFAHGPTTARFLYLSWRLVDASKGSWIRRVKIPLSAVTVEQIDAIEKEGGLLQTDVTGRRPHDMAPVVWQRVRPR